MTLKMYTIKDELNGHTAPIPLNNDETAKRYFAEIKRTNPQVVTEPKDFSIWYIGDFETETGIMIPNEPKLIERG